MVPVGYELDERVPVGIEPVVLIYDGRQVAGPKWTPRSLLIYSGGGLGNAVFGGWFLG